MNIITDVDKLKADLAGDLAVQLSKVLTVTAVLAEHYHADAKRLKIGGHIDTFYKCPNSTCISTHQLIEDSRQLIEQGV